jgi:hypothetical protein
VRVQCEARFAERTGETLLNSVEQMQQFMHSRVASSIAWCTKKLRLLQEAPKVNQHTTSCKQRLASFRCCLVHEQFFRS